MSRPPASAAVVGELAARAVAGRPNVLEARRLFILAGLAAVLIYTTSVAVLPRRYGHIVVGDGIHYYVYLRSLVIDGDLDFTNEYAEFNQAITEPDKQVNTRLRTPTGLAHNMFAVGPALAALPLYLLAHGLSLAGHAAGLPLRVDGYGTLYEGSFALAGVLASVAGAACAYAVLRRLLPREPALLGVAGIWLGGSLLYYTIASPVYAHGFSALGVAAWLLTWSRLDARRPRAWLLLGLLGGLMAIMRWQEALFALLPLLLFTYDLTRGRRARAGALSLTSEGPDHLPDPLALGEGQGEERPGGHIGPPLQSSRNPALVSLSLWERVRVRESQGEEGPSDAGVAPTSPSAGRPGRPGRPHWSAPTLPSELGTRNSEPGPRLPLPLGEGRGEGIRDDEIAALLPRLAAYGLGLILGFAPQMAAWTILFGAPLAVPQGASFFTWSDPHWLDVLVSARNGLFTWTPVALPAVAGLLLLLRRHPRWAVMALLALLLQVLVNGLLADWWAGAAFGARRFGGTAAFLALGLGWCAALLWPGRRRLAVAVVALLVGLNGLLVVQYSAALKGWTTLDTYPTLRQLTIERFTWPFTYLTRR